LIGSGEGDGTARTSLADGEGSTGFWKTFPGVLTAVAAVITAVGGLFAVLFQAGIIGHSPARSPAAMVQTQVKAPVSSSAAPSGASRGRAWTDVEAIWTAKDGTVTSMRAETVRFCISAGTGINLNDSQDIQFEKMSSIEVLRSDPQFTSGGRATLRVTLASGSILEGTITSGCDFFGQTDAGRYSLYPDKLLKIEFVR
jgi:hypothetical protein